MVLPIKKESKPRKLILPIFLGLVMILSVIGFSLTYGSGNPSGSDSGIVKYNGYVYTRTQNGWVVDIPGSGKAQFAYNPKELESIQLPEFTKTDKVYLAYDPDNTDQNIDLIIQKLNNMLLYFNIRPVKACINDSNNCPNIPIVNCNQQDSVIVIIKGDSQKAYNQDSCLYLEGRAEDLDKMTDKLAMKMLGLI